MASITSLQDPIITQILNEIQNRADATRKAEEAAVPALQAQFAIQDIRCSISYHRINKVDIGLCGHTFESSEIFKLATGFMVPCPLCRQITLIVPPDDVLARMIALASRRAKVQEACDNRSLYPEEEYETKEAIDPDEEEVPNANRNMLFVMSGISSVLIIGGVGVLHALIQDSLGDRPVNIQEMGLTGLGAAAGYALIKTAFYNEHSLRLLITASSISILAMMYFYPS